MPGCQAEGRGGSCTGVGDRPADARRARLWSAPDADTVEIAVLRHQLAVLRRQVPRPRYTPTDRMLLAALARLLPRERWAALMVTPSTVLRWHRQLVARRWTYPRSGGGRRGLDQEVVELVLRLARENPRWGYIRIVGSAAPSAFRYQRRRCGGSCAGTASARHPARAARRGRRSSRRRPVGCWRVTSLPSRPSA